MSDGTCLPRPSVQMSDAGDDAVHVGPNLLMHGRPERRGSLLIQVQEAVAVDMEGTVPPGAGHQLQAEAAALCAIAYSNDGRRLEERRKHEREEKSAQDELHGHFCCCNNG